LMISCFRSRYNTGEMKQVIVLKLQPSPEQHQALLATLQAVNRACQYVADVAYERRLANKIALQPLVYGTLRREYGLSSQMALLALRKAVEAYKRDRRVHVRIDLHAAMVYDQRILSFKGLTHASLLTLSGRVLVPMRFGAYQAARMERAKGQADLVYRDGAFFLYVTVDLPTPEPIEPEGVLGIDLGIVQIALDSDGEAHTGHEVMACRKRVREHRQKLQKRRTRSAYKRLKQQSRCQSRFIRDVNHCISLVKKALSCRKALALETLKGIREREHGSGQMRWLLGNWAFAQLGAFLGYKAQAVGLAVVEVDPAYTSQTCSACGHCERSNRASQSKFCCQKCGLEINADQNGALNIRARAEWSCRLLFHSAVAG
jgi:putative transposase